jgi:hypothetical protein
VAVEAVAAAESDAVVESDDDVDASVGDTLTGTV